MSKIGYLPLGSRVLIKELPIEDADRKNGLIDIPENAIPHRRGIVAAVGSGDVAAVTGTKIEMTVEVGDKVLYLAEAAHIPIRIGNQEYKLMRENLIEAIIE